MSSATIVIGLGNPVLSDDSIGWRVIELLRAEPLPDHVHIEEACVGGLSLAEMLIGYDRAIIVDSIMTQGGVPGSVHHLHLSDLCLTLNSASAHDTNLTTALAALRRFGAAVPADEAIEFVAIEVQDVWTFSERCTPDVEQSIPVAVTTVRNLLSRVV